MDPTPSSFGTVEREPAQARRLAAVLGAAVEVDSLGGQSRTYRVTGTDYVVTVPFAWPDDAETAAALVRRITLQERIARRVTIPVPRVVRTLPELGIAVIRRLNGERLIDVVPAQQQAIRAQVAAVLGTMLGKLHTWKPAGYEDVAAPDDYSPENWRQLAAECGRDLAAVLDDRQRLDVKSFLAQPAPGSTVARVLSHHDLGIEHVLVSTRTITPAVTGVIDWDDAAICDPAFDFGLLLRDLGPEALDIALGTYAAAGGNPRDIPHRAKFYARCKLLEDLAFGYDEDRPQYIEKSHVAWGAVFRAGGGN